MAKGSRRRKNLFTKIKKPSTFRKMACAWWQDPKNPQIYGSMDVEASKLTAFLKEYSKKNKINVTFTHAVIKASALAYRKYPYLNVKVEGKKMYQRNSIDIMVLVSLGSGKDLSALKINSVDEMSLADIAKRIRKDADKARKGNVPKFQASRNIMSRLSARMATPVIRIAGWLVNKMGRDLTRFGFPQDPFGTAIISSVGMFGVDTAYAPLLPLAKSGLLLVVNEVRKRPWVVDDEVVVRPVMRLCGTFDHRIFNGHQASKIANEFKRLLGKPELLLEQ